MPGFRDAEELDRETDRLVAERQAETEAAERGRQQQERTTRVNEAKKSRDDSLLVVQTSARNIAAFDEQLAWCRAALRNWNERNRGFLNVTATEVALFALLIVSPFAVVTLDMLMLSYVGREIARGAIEALKGAGGNNIGGTVLVAVVLFTLGYVVVELVIGAARDNDQLGRELRRRSAQLAVMLWITLPLFIVIFSLVSSGIFSADSTKTIGRATLTAAIVRAALFGLFAMAIHGFILWFGSAIVNAYGYLFYKARQLHIARRMRGLERRRREAGGDLESSFRNFHGAVTTDREGAPVTVGPFGDMTARVTNTEFGTDVIETPGSHQPQQPPAANSSGPTRRSSYPDGDGRRSQADRAANNSEPREPPPDQQNGSEAEGQWPGTVYDMSDEDEVS